MTHGAWPLLAAATFGTATLSAIAGFGGGLLLLPVFVAAFGLRDAVAGESGQGGHGCVGQDEDAGGRGGDSAEAKAATRRGRRVRCRLCPAR
jgi:hypothetical protein